MLIQNKKMPLGAPTPFGRSTKNVKSNIDGK